MSEDEILSLSLQLSELKEHQKEPFLTQYLNTHIVNTTKEKEIKNKEYREKLKEIFPV